jgi:hypothetical protein
VLRTSISVTAAAIAATCALAACGPVRMGSAAVVGSERISATTLSNEVANLTQAYEASKSKIQLQFPLSEAPQEVLSWLLRFRVRNEMAVRNHVAVSTGQSERALASIAASAGSTGIKNLAVANGLPPDLLPDLGRYEAIQNNLFARLNGGTLPRTQARIQALSPVFGERECVAAKSLNIQVNPQFGQMDYGTLSVIPATSPLSAPTAPAPAPSTKPRLTPPS